MQIKHLSFLMALFITTHLKGIEPILTHYDEATIRETLLNEIPNLTINSLNIISTGWDNLVAEVNGEWIFRFAREQKFIGALKREQRLLDRLHNKISLPIPHYVFFGLNTAFVGYRKIPGEPILNEAVYLLLSHEQRQEIAETLALFLTQMHSAISVEEALQWGYKKYEVPMELIETVVVDIQSPEAKRIICEALSYIKKHPYNTDHLVLLHNDLHGENFTVDETTHKVIGVFDFSDAALGNPCIEFAQLFNIHHDLAIRTMNAYARLTNDNNDIVPAAVEFILRRARYIHYAQEEKNRSRELELITMLEHFAPVWDSLVAYTI